MFVVSNFFLFESFQLVQITDQKHSNSQHYKLNLLIIIFRECRFNVACITVCLLQRFVQRRDEGKSLASTRNGRYSHGRHLRLNTEDLWDNQTRSGFENNLPSKCSTDQHTCVCRISRIFHLIVIL